MGVRRGHDAPAEVRQGQRQRLDRHDRRACDRGDGRTRHVCALDQINADLVHRSARAAGGRRHEPVQGIHGVRERTPDPDRVPAREPGRNHARAAVRYAAIVVRDAVNWQAGGFTPIAETDAQVEGQAAEITGFPLGGPFVNGRMYTQDVATKVHNETQIRVPTDFHEGASGGPVYVRGRSDAIGLFSYGRVLGWLGRFATRVTPQMLENIARWAVPLTLQDQICRLQIVIHTGDLGEAGTDEPISLSERPSRRDLSAGASRQYDVEQQLVRGKHHVLRQRSAAVHGGSRSLAVLQVVGVAVP